MDNICHLKSEGQMEMMMMMQMDKISELCGAYNDVVSDLAPPSNHTFPAATTTILPNYTTNNPSLISHHHHHPFPNLPTPSTTISFTGTNPANEQTPNAFSSTPSQKSTSMAAMREMIFRIAAMQPIHIDPESVKPPKRRNVKISKDPQSVAARHRRERISERIRILQRLVPGGTKMDTASMLDEAIHYVKFLKTQVQTLERAAANRTPGLGFPVAMSSGTYAGVHHQPPHHHLESVAHFGDA